MFTIDGRLSCRDTYVHQPLLKCTDTAPPEVYRHCTLPDVHRHRSSCSVQTAHTGAATGVAIAICVFYVSECTQESLSSRERSLSRRMMRGSSAIRVLSALEFQIFTSFTVRKKHSALRLLQRAVVCLFSPLSTYSSLPLFIRRNLFLLPLHVFFCKGIEKSRTNRKKETKECTRLLSPSYASPLFSAVEKVHGCYFIRGGFSKIVFFFFVRKNSSTCPSSAGVASQ